MEVNRLTKILVADDLDKYLGFHFFLDGCESRNASKVLAKIGLLEG